MTLTGDGAVVDTSDPLPVAGASGWSGAGPASGAMAPLVATDGTVSVIDEAGGRAVVHAVDASGARASGWPYTGPSGLQWQGTCGPAVTGCGVWRALPALGPTGTLYLPLAAPDSQIGGTLAAVGRDGAPVQGWPMHLARRGAEFWSVAIGPDGVVFTVAVEPEAAGTTSATIVAFSPGGKVIFRFTIVDPAVAG